MTKANAVTLAPGVVVSIDEFITMRLGMFGMSGAGKSNGFAHLAELLYDVGAPFTYIDPFGAAWGLRSSADGKSPGLNVPIIGGYHGDLPLRSDAGALVARELYELDASAVVDLSAFSAEEQAIFVKAYFDAVFALHLQRKKLRAILLDEAAESAPEKPTSAADYACAVSIARVHKGGRAQGIGLKTATQSSAEQSKRTIKQDEMIVALRTFSPLDQKPIVDYLQTKVEAAEAKRIKATLSELKDGEAWFLAPRLGIVKRARFPMRRTFDSGATPKRGDVAQEPVTLADVDLDRLRSALERDVDTIAGDDPVALRARIAQLEAQVKGASKAVEIRPERVEVPVLSPEALHGLQNAANALLQAAGVASVAARLVGEPLERLGGAESGREEAPKAPPARAIARSTPAAAPAGGAGLKAGARRMLVALFRVGRPLTRRELGTLANVQMGGTMSEYVTKLRTEGYVEERDGVVSLTIKAKPIVDGASSQPPTTDEIIELHAPHLKRGMRSILTLLVQQYPRPLKRAVLSAQAGVKLGGTMSEYVTTLKRRGLIEETSHGARAADVLFLERPIGLR